MKSTFYIAAELTAQQAAVLEEYIKGTPCVTACTLLGITSQLYSQSLYTAFYKLLQAIVKSRGRTA